MTTTGAIVRVRTEVAALAKAFDYSVPSGWTHDVVVGTRVRMPLHGRSVRGWVVDDQVEAPSGVDLLPLKSWLGWGPPPAVVELADWAAWRWAGPVSSFLSTASPDTIVRTLPGVPTATAALGTSEPPPWASALGGSDPVVVRLPPATDLIDLVVSVAGDPAVLARTGSVVVLVPSVGWAERLTARLNRRGWPATTDWTQARAGWPIVVGNRAGAWTPVPKLAAAVVLDAHDASYREESAPTYSAVDVLTERARRAGASCLLVSPVPPAQVSGLTTVTPPVPVERAGWPVMERVDRRGADPRTGMFSEEFVRLARMVLDDSHAGERGPLVCVYNRTGGARLLACAHCRDLACCARCGAAAARVGKAGDSGHGSLTCPRCGETRPAVCATCGRLRMKTLRAGVSRFREELAALLGVAVDEVAGPAGNGAASPPPTWSAPLLIGTEAVLHRVRRAAAVAFLDVDLHLLAPRLSATDDTLALFVRAARLVGPRGSGPSWARVQVQTRVPDHPLLECVSRGDPAPVLADEVEVRRAAGLPPFSALAVVTGTLAPEFSGALESAAAGSGVTVSAVDDGRYLLRAPVHGPLCDLLAEVPRPSGRGLRVEVDPTTV